MDLPTDSQTLTLPSGRTLGYAEYGSPSGTPLIYFHGFPASRLDISGLHPLAQRLGVRILSLDRPGFGLSTHDPSRKITDWPTDVQDFAEQKNIKKFSVLGVSGGGPYALACARLLPMGMVTKVGVAAGAPIWDDGVRTKGMPWFARLVYVWANYWPWGLRVASAGLVGTTRWLMGTAYVEKKIDGMLEAMTKAKKEKDAEKTPLLNKEDGFEVQEETRPTAERRERLKRILFEGFAQGTAGWVHEAQLLTGDWGIEFEEIPHEVYIWHGAKDKNAPVESLREIARRTPHCVYRELDSDHFQMGNYFEEVLEALTGDGKKES